MRFRYRASPGVLVAALVASFLVPTQAGADTSATASIVVTARFSTRTSLTVSADLLRFDVPGADGVATAIVDFAAGARTEAGAEVRLSVEAVEPPEPVDTGAPLALTFGGIGAGLSAGALKQGSPTVAGRWNGSGRRTGRLVFALKGPSPGYYAVPVRFLLTAP